MSIFFLKTFKISNNYSCSLIRINCLQYWSASSHWYTYTSYCLLFSADIPYHIIALHHCTFFITMVVVSRWLFLASIVTMAVKTIWLQVFTLLSVQVKYFLKYFSLALVKKNRTIGSRHRQVRTSFCLAQGDQMPKLRNQHKLLWRAFDVNKDYQDEATRIISFMLCFDRNSQGAETTFHNEF